MISNYPPGVTESMIPGNRPEDQEVEVTIVLTKGDIDDIINEYPENYGFIWDDIKNQIKDQYD